MKLSRGLLFNHDSLVAAQSYPSEATVNDPLINAWTGKLLDALAAEQSWQQTPTPCPLFCFHQCLQYFCRPCLKDLRTVYGVDDFAVRPLGRETSATWQMRWQS